MKVFGLSSFKQGIKPGCDFFIEADPQADLSAVVRPRSSPLLVKVDTVRGPKHVWATFSQEQVDLNYANPEVLMEVLKILLLYVQKGAKYLRLDAVGFYGNVLELPASIYPRLMP